MNEHAIQKIVEEVVQQLYKKHLKSSNIPIAVSARHCHLSQGDLEVLFGKGYQLTKKADLSQPGQFAANETVTIIGPRGSIEKVRILGPARSLTQVEVSKTDSIRLGLNTPIRESGNIEGSAPITLVGPLGSIFKNEGLIIAQAHIHMSPNDAQVYGVQNGEYVQIKTGNERPVSFDKVLIRVSQRYKLEMHIDTDEANAGLITSGQTGCLVKYEGIRGGKVDDWDKYTQEPPLPDTITNQDRAVFENKLLSEREVRNWKDNTIVIYKHSIVTPLARDTARELGKTIRVIDQ
jgi:putative phosphotransacetylase